MSLSELESFFATANLPETISITQGETITDVKAFVTGHLDIVRKNGNVPAFAAFADRLQLLKQVIESKPSADHQSSSESPTDFQ